jgi:hypothetical protein
VTEVVLFELSLHRLGYIVIRVSVVLQVHFDIAHELVVLGEYRNDRNLYALQLTLARIFTTTYHSGRDKCP